MATFPLQHCRHGSTHPRGGVFCQLNHSNELPPPTLSRTHPSAVPASRCRQYEQDSYDQLVKTIEGQDLLPQVGWDGQVASGPPLLYSNCIATVLFPLSSQSMP